MNGTQDLLVKKLAGEVCDSDFPIPLSHEIGTNGMLARESETLLSSAIFKIADSAYCILHTAPFRTCTRSTGRGFIQNKRNIMASDYAREYPVFTSVRFSHKLYNNGDK